MKILTEKEERKFQLPQMLLNDISIDEKILFQSNQILNETPTKEKSYLLITDKKIYIHTYNFWFRNEWVETINLLDINYVIFKAINPYNKKYIGGVEFIFNIPDVFFTSLFNVPDMTSFQNLFESILFEYTDIKKRWNHIKEKINFRIPHLFKISPIQTITVEKERVISSKNGSSIIVPLDKTISLNYETSKKRSDLKKRRWDEKFDEINIFLNSSDINLEFGPLSNFTDLYEYFYCYFFVWKAKNGYFFTMDQLKDLSIETKIIDQTPKYKDFEKEFKGMEIDFKSSYNDIYQEIQNYLDSDEKIMLYYIPKKTPKHEIYIFTNKKVIFKYSRKYDISLYSNIGAIARHNAKQKTYGISLGLINSLKGIRYFNKYSINILKIPSENNLFEKLKYLIEKM
ncbi:MAG: hypothetical protein ACFFDG_13935 [Promethearchaeota archaeon]